MRRVGISAKLVLGTACILILLGLAVTWYSVSQLGVLLRQQMEERVQAQANNWIEQNRLSFTLFLDIAVDEETRDSGAIDFVDEQETLHRVAEQLQEKEWIAYVILLDQSGNVRASAGPPEDLVERPLQAETGSWDEYRDAQGNSYFELTMQISASGTGMSSDLEAVFGASQSAEETYLGWLRVGVDREEFDRRLDTFANRNIGLAAVLVALAVLLSFLFAGRIVTPITEMGRIATQIARGDLSRRVKRGADLQDEVGELVRNFNTMAGEISLLKTGLEKKVQERTRELEEANRKLEERDRLRSVFVSTVSHEFRTPLTSIKLYAGNLLDAADPRPEKVRRSLEIIDEETDRLTRLIDDVLDMRRLELDVVDWRMADTDLEELVRKSTELLNPQAAKKAIELRASELEHQRVHADPDWIQRVINNLIGNAIKFSGQGSRVEVALARTSTAGPGRRKCGECALVRVADSGPGIPEEDLSRVFEPFYLAKRRPSKVAGTGLGLAISREVVSHHKGEIWAESREGSGSTFYFTLPLVTSSNLGEPVVVSE